MAMTAEERLDKIEQTLKDKNLNSEQDRGKEGVISIVTGQRLLPVAGAVADSAELLTKADFRNAFEHTALTRGMLGFDSLESPAPAIDKIIDYSKKALAKCLFLQDDEAVICECVGGQEFQAYPKSGFNMFGPSSVFEESFGLTADKSMKISMNLFYMNEALEGGMKLQPVAVRESVKSGLSKQLKIFAEYIASRETPDAEYIKCIQRIKNNASRAMLDMIDRAGSEGTQSDKKASEESGVSKRLSRRLRGEAVFLGMIEGVEIWARKAWKKNPQLLDFYKTARLSSVAEKLQNYDKDEILRNICKDVGVPVDFFDGKDFEWRNVKAENREQLKKALMDSARSFIPDANNMGPGMEMWFWNAGNHWMNSGIPERWQEFNEYCSNPDYDESLSWNED